MCLFSADVDEASSSWGRFSGGLETVLGGALKGTFEATVTGVVRTDCMVILGNGLTAVITGAGLDICVGALYGWYCFGWSCFIVGDCAFMTGVIIFFTCFVWGAKRTLPTEVTGAPIGLAIGDFVTGRVVTSLVTPLFDSDTCCSIAEDSPEIKQ